MTAAPFVGLLGIKTVIRWNVLLCVAFYIEGRTSEVELTGIFRIPCDGSRTAI